MTETPKSKLANAYDELATAKDLNEAIHMACGYLGNTCEKSAIQAVSDAVAAKISQVLDMIEGVQEELP
jgi:hypothetical protein